MSLPYHIQMDSGAGTVVPGVVYLWGLLESSLGQEDHTRSPAFHSQPEGVHKAMS